MRQPSLCLLLVLTLASPLLHAQQEPSSTRFEQHEHDQPNQTAPVPVSAAAVTTEASARNESLSEEQIQLAQLRQENRRLRMQLHQEQARASEPRTAAQLLTEEQQWFAIGGGVGILGFLLGVLATRGGRRRQWLN